MDAVGEQTALSSSSLPISSETVGQVIRQIETEQDLLQFEVDGWCVWPLLRFSVALELMNLPFAATKESFALKELLLIAAKDTYRLLFPRRAQVVALTLSSELMERDGERFRNVFFDELLPELGSYFKIETLNNKSFLSRSRNALIPSDVTSTGFGLLSTVVMPKLKGGDEIPRVAQQISERLRRHPQLQRFSAERIHATLERFYWQKKLFAKLFRRIKPIHVLTADGYSDHAAIAAAKENQIRVGEFQHGAFMRGGPEYGWSSYAAAYKSRMPVPDQFFLFGDYWKELLQPDGFWGAALVSAGSLRMDQYRKLKLNETRDHHDRSCRILLTTQGVDTERLIEFVSEFLRVANRDDLQLVIKLHPAYESDKRVYEEAFAGDKRVQIISGSEEPSTYEVLLTTDFHVSISSTCHFEALGLGVPTIILPLANSEFILSLHRRGDALLAATPLELADIVANASREVPESLSSYYFKPNALENIKQALASSA